MTESLSLQKQFEKWIFTEKDGFTYAYRNLRSIEGFKFAVRVGLDGVILFGKNGFGPNLHYLDPHVTAALEDFDGKRGEGFRPFEIGCIQRNGEYWFSDCFYEPGLIDEDFKELKSIMLAIQLDYQKDLLHKGNLVS